ncbi:breast cancer type 2 susceptibility protein homolog isoform X2 [Mytilus trossulus]|uniref:breast cancer type 2 susceptibility protein homolog isoform X2 n=1 Tax=Mytilus trossulus TaxID=6551 RepID=UPI0030056C4B
MVRIYKTYIKDKVKLENELGKGNPNWFVEASRHPKEKDSSVTPISLKCMQDSYNEDSPVYISSHLLESQFSATSPLTGWMPPSLGISPVNGTAQQYVGSQYDLVKSLGVNDSTLSWTSSLATPNHADLEDRDSQTQAQAKRKGFSRMLFSPGNNMTSETMEVCTLKESPVTKVNSKLLQENNEPNHSTEIKVNSYISSQEKNRGKIDTPDLTDALSDFFDPPSKAAGRRRSAPSSRRNSFKTKPPSCLSSISFTQGDSDKNNIIEDLFSSKDQHLNKCQNECPSKPSVETDEKCNQITEKFDHCESVKQESTDLGKLDLSYSESSRLSEMSVENANKITMENEEECLHENTQNLIENEEFSQADLFCSTPYDVNRTYKSILSTAKKKTPASKKRVRFDKDLDENFIISNELDINTSSAIGNSGKKIRKTIDNLSDDVTIEMETDNSKTDNNGKGCDKETDDLFSQVSPSALQEMCSVSSDKLEESPCTGKPSASIDNLTKSDTNNQTASIPVSPVTQINKIVPVLEITIQPSKDVSETENLSCATTSPEKTVSVETSSHIKTDSLLRKPGKIKRFFYPTNSQINTSCPKSVYGFKQQPKETADNNIKDKGQDATIKSSVNTKIASGTERTPTTHIEMVKTSPATNTTTLASGNTDSRSRSLGSGFKRYSDLVEVPAKSSAEKINKSTSDMYTRVSRTTKDMSSTPTSTKRDSTEIKRKRLCLNHQDSNENCSSKKTTKELSSPKFPYEKTVKELTSPKLLIEKTTSPIRSTSASDIPNPESDMFDDDLPDDSFAKEISMDGTLEKLSGNSDYKGTVFGTSESLSANLNKSGKSENLEKVLEEGMLKITPNALKNNFMEQYKQNVEIVRSDAYNMSEKQSVNVMGEMFQGFHTAAGGKINITESKLSEAEKLMVVDSSDLMAEFTDDFIVDRKLEVKKRTEFEKVKLHEDTMLMKREASLASGIETKVLDVKIEHVCINVNKKSDLNKKSEIIFRGDRNLEKKLNSSHAVDGNNSVLGEHLQPLNKQFTESSEKNVNKGKTLPVSLNLEIRTELQESHGLSGGFSTASGTGIKFSNANLSKAQKLFDEKENVAIGENLSSKPKNNGFASASGKQLPMSLSSLSKAEKLMEDMISENKASVSNVNPINRTGGFSTAGGNSFKISPSSLSKAKALILDPENSPCLIEGNMPEQLKQTKNYNFHCRGFSTASGKQFNISESSLSKAQSLMKESQDQEQSDISENDKVAMPGFASASGKSLNLSKSSLLKAQNFMDEKELQVVTPESTLKANTKTGLCNGLLSGFSSASRKGLNISSASISKATCLMKEINGEQEHLSSDIKAKKEDFEELFSNILKQNESNDLLTDTAANTNLLVESDLEKELENMLTNKQNKKESVQVQPTKSSRFPPGSNVPKGFRPFKAPKIISKTKVVQNIKSVPINSTSEVDSAKDVMIKVDMGEPLKQKPESEDNYGGHTSDLIKQNNNNNIDSTYLDEVFSEEMLASQKFSPESGRPLKKCGRKRLTSSITSDDLELIEAERSVELTKCTKFEHHQTNESKNVTFTLGTGGDNKITRIENSECDLDIDFKGDNSQFALEEVMDPGNEFTQVLVDNDEAFLNCEDSAKVLIQEKRIQAENLVQPMKSNSNITTDSTLDIIPQITTKSAFLNEKSEMDVDPDTTFNFKYQNPFQSASGKTVFVSEKALQQARQTMNEDTKKIDGLGDSFPHPRKSMESTISNPFQSASGKSVCVSEKALQQARQTMNEDSKNIEGLGESFPHPRKSLESTISNPFQSASGKTVRVSQKALVHARKTLDDENIGLFHSASGKSVEVSESALQHARKTLDDSNSIPSVSGKNISVSPKSLQHARQTLADDNSNPFQSASGKIVQISEAALKHARGTFNEEIITPVLKDNDLRKETLKDISDAPFQSASGKNVLVSKKALCHARKTLKEEMTNPFQSASGKNFEISEKAFQQARKTLNEEMTNPFQSASGKNVEISEKALQQARKTLNEELTNPFQSASGKNVEISEKALHQARKTLNEEMTNPFQSASGKNVEISEKAFQQARKTLNEELTNPFQSASGKNVEISEKALQQARKTLNDEMTNPFQSASGKNVEISEKALQQARKTLKEENNDPSVKDVTHSEKNLKGTRNTLNNETNNPFQSASGKGVSISEESLQQAKKTLNDQTLIPFQSASGNSMIVSEQSLKHARKTLCDDSINTPKCVSGNSEMNSEKAIQQERKSSGQNHSVQCVPVSKRVLPFSDDHYNKNMSPSHQTSRSSVDNTKRKRSDFDDDFDIPLEMLEQMEMYGKRQRTDVLDGRKRQSLSAGPEDYSKDRQVPGFSPKPLKSQSVHTNQRTRIQEYLSSDTSIDTNVLPKSTFKTPYKPSSGPTEDITTVYNNKVKVAAPVFVSKTANSHGKKINDQQTRVPLQPKMTNNVKVENQSGIRKEISGQGLKSKGLNQTSAMNEISKDTVQMIGKARKQQEDKIKERSKRKVVPVEGRLFQMKQSHKRLKLKDVISLHSNIDQSAMRHIHPSTRKVRCSNAALHKFYLPDFYGKNVHHIIVGDGAMLVPDDKGYAGKDEFYQAFLTIDNVDCKLLEEKWFYNHYRWVVWKLAAYEVTSAVMFAGRCLTPEVVMLQMKYRYDREIDKCQRSAIMKICEKDDTPCKRMVLCVSNITTDVKEPKISLTDGWYSIKAKVDGPLSNLINKGCIQIGHKLCISGAELTGSQDACPPLEAPEALMLKISTNSTRPASWDSILGFQTDHTPLCVPLTSIQGEGGLIGCVDVVVVRKYPTMYMEKLQAGGCIFRSYAAEEKYKQSFQQLQQEKMEKLYQQLESRFEKDNKEERCIKRKKYSCKEIEQLSSGEDIYEAINSAKHPDDIQTYLSSDQLELLMEHQRCVQEEKRQKMNSEFQKIWNDGDEKNQQRNVIPLMKVRLVGCCRKDTDSQMSSLLSIWRPTSTHNDLKEGHRYKAYSLSAAPARSGSGGVQLTTTKQTQFKPLALDDNILDMIYEPREVLTKQDIVRKRPAFKEADIVGIVIMVNNTNFEHSGKQQDIVYVADINDDLIGIKFWGGVKHCGLSDTLQEGVICCCSNLCDKSNYPSISLPVLDYSTELSVLSQSPQYPSQRKHIDKLKEKLKEKTEFLIQAKERLHDKLNARNSLASVNKSPEKNSSEILLESKTPNNPKTTSKMAALLSYSSPSPISPILLSSTKSIHKAFKPPSLTR